MVAGQCQRVSVDEATKLPGNAGDRCLWVALPCGCPIPGTLAALIHRHGRFLVRLAAEAFQPVPPLSAFRIIGYRRVTDPVDRPYIAFKLLDPENDRFAWFPTTSANAVAAMARHATAEAAKHRPKGLGRFLCPWASRRGG